MSLCSDDSDGYWDDAFKIHSAPQRAAPKLLSGLVEKILTAGKELNILRRLKAPLPPPFALIGLDDLLVSSERTVSSRFPSQVLQEVINTAIDKRSAAVHKALMDALWDRSKMKDHLNATGALLLLDDGLVLSAVHDRLLRMFRSSHVWTPAEFSARLSDALKPYVAGYPGVCFIVLLTSS